MAKAGTKWRGTGEADQDKGPVGEPDKDNSPVDCCPGERPSHGRLGPVPKRSRECAAAGIVPLNGLATDGKHRTCKREHGQRSAASPRSRQAQGRAGNRRGSGESAPRRARTPRTVHTALSSKAGEARAKKVPCANPLIRQARREGTPHLTFRVRGAESGADGFGNFGQNRSSSSAGTRPG